MYEKFRKFFNRIAVKPGCCNDDTLDSNGCHRNTAGIVNSLEALISLVSGLLSAILVAWLKKKWDK
jgi:hypothetical protein